MVLYSKVVTIRDKQLMENKRLEQEWVDEQKKLKEWVGGALDRLNPREQFIISERRLSDTGRTLESLGKELGLSKERVRQLEAAAFTKMRKNLNSNDALKLMIN